MHSITWILLQVSNKDPSHWLRPYLTRKIKKCQYLRLTYLDPDRPKNIADQEADNGSHNRQQNGCTEIKRAYLNRWGREMEVCHPINPGLADSGGDHDRPNYMYEPGDCSCGQTERNGKGFIHMAPVYASTGGRPIYIIFQSFFHG